MRKDWYSVKGLFRWYFKESGEPERIEERVVLFQAESLDQALDFAAAEAKRYCSPDPKANFQIEPMGWWRAYWVGEDPATGVEVFSRSCKTTLSGDAFIRRYYPK